MYLFNFPHITVRLGYKSQGLEGLKIANCEFSRTQYKM